MPGDQGITLLIDIPDGWQLPPPWRDRVEQRQVSLHEHFRFEPARAYMYEVMTDVWAKQALPFSADPDTLTTDRVSAVTRPCITLRPDELLPMLAAFTIDLHIAYDKRYQALALIYPPDA
jgi:hypothetical protein